MPSLIEQTDTFETLLDFYRWGCCLAKKHGLFYGHGTETLEEDIMALVLGTVGLAYDTPWSVLSARITLQEKDLLASQLEKRVMQRIPVPYLTREALFYDHVFYVDERVLIPRSPIQELIRQAFSPWLALDAAPLRILDLCTGSGCIAIACCLAFPEAEVDALDISKEALAVAEINRTRHAVEHQLTLYASDGFKQLPLKQYDLIVSNPPYVPEQEWLGLPQEYLHEPKLALYAEDNGLALVHHILMHAKSYLTAQGILIVEVGHSKELLIEAYPDIPFVWLDFEQGGEGVFLLTAADLHYYF